MGWACLGVMPSAAKSSVWFGGTEAGGVLTPTGDEGKFNFKGYVSIRVVGKGVNEVKEAIVSIAPSTPITLGE